jgi:cardiolipin synthase
MYIFREGEIGARVRDALVDAAARGVKVRVLTDAFGCLEMSRDYLKPIDDAGGECRCFNPLELRRFPYRDHRKLVVVDGETAFVGGFNIGPEYNGDGRTEGWHDLGMVLRGALVPELLQAFHTMFGAARLRHPRLSRFRKSLTSRRVGTPDGDLFLLAPGRAPNPARDALVEDILRAKRVHLTSAYFLAPRRLRRAMAAAARGGAQVRLLVPGKSDVRLAQLAARGQYSALLRAGVEIYEYEPQVLHSKRYLLDDIAYVGSANLDLRSLSINYELLVRVQDRDFAEEGHAHFEEDLQHSRRVLRAEWRRRGWWNRLAERVARAILVGIDLQFAMSQWSRIVAEEKSIESAAREARAIAEEEARKLKPSRRRLIHPGNHGG